MTLLTASAAAPPGESPARLAARAATLRRLEATVLRRVDGRLFGSHRGVLSGPGSERAGARRYEAGDDARLMDWTVTARSLDPHVRTTEPDREVDTLAVVDRSPSLDFGTALCEKRELAVAAAAVFGGFAVRAGEPFGVLVCGLAELTTVAPGRGRAAYLAALSRVAATERRASGPPEAADLPAAIARAGALLRRRGQVIVISDFPQPPQGPAPWLRPLRRLGLRHSVVAVVIHDPRDTDLPAVGSFIAIDPESGRSVPVRVTPQVRARFADAAAAAAAARRRALRQAGCAVLDLSTGRDWLEDALRFAEQRRREGRP